MSLSLPAPSAEARPILAAEGLVVRPEGAAAAVVQDVALAVRAGEVWAILGPNGAGKSSLLRALAGEWRPVAGSVRLAGRLLASWPLPELARHRAVLTQHPESPPGATVAEVVELGRLPFAESARESHAHARALLGRLDLAGLDERPTERLSGGEARRVHLARVLAQATPPTGRVLLLDEPLAGLDLVHQHQVMGLAQQWAREGAAVVMVLHEPALTLTYATHALLLRAGRAVASGRVTEVLTPALLETVFDVQVAQWHWPDGWPVVATRPKRA